MGPSQFTENRNGNVMLEARISGEGVADFEDNLEDKRTLVDNYFLAVSVSHRDKYVVVTVTDKLSQAAY